MASHNLDIFIPTASGEICSIFEIDSLKDETGQGIDSTTVELEDAFEIIQRISTEDTSLRYFQSRLLEQVLILIEHGLSPQTSPYYEETLETYQKNVVDSLNHLIKMEPTDHIISYRFADVVGAGVLQIARNKAMLNSGNSKEPDIEPSLRIKFNNKTTQKSWIYTKYPEGVVHTEITDRKSRKYLPAQVFREFNTSTDQAVPSDYEAVIEVITAKLISEMKNLWNLKIPKDLSGLV